MMSSSTSKWPNTQQFREILALRKRLYRSESEFKCFEYSHVTSCHVTTYMHTIPSPSIETFGEVLGVLYTVGAWKLVFGSQQSKGSVELVISKVRDFLGDYLYIVVNAVFLGSVRTIPCWPRIQFRSLHRSVTRGKRSRKPKEESNASDDVPSAKKLRQDVKGSSPTTSKASSSSKKPSGYRFQDVSILQRVILASSVCKECLEDEGSLHLFERPFGCGLARTFAGPETVLTANSVPCTPNSQKYNKWTSQNWNGTAYVGPGRGGCTPQNSW